MGLNRKEKTEKRLYTGFFSGTVRGYVNPTAAQLAEMKGYTADEDAKDPVYEDKDKDGNDRITLSFWLQSDGPEKAWFNKKFRLVNKEVVGKESGKTQWVNQVGGDFGSAWVDEEKNLTEKFTKYQVETSKGSKEYKNIADKVYRKAIFGEDALNNFLHKWYANVDFKKADKEGKWSTVLIDKNRIFRNVDKYVHDEYQPLVDVQNRLDKEENINKKREIREKELYTGPVVCMATVYTGEKEGEVVHYQNVYDTCLSGYMMKKVSFALSSNNWTGDKGLESWYKQFTDIKYGCKDAYSMTMLEPFDPDQHIQASNDTIRVANEVPNGDLY